SSFTRQSSGGLFFQPALYPFAYKLFHITGHFRERRAGKKNFLDAFALHLQGAVVRNRAPAPAENCYVISAVLLQLANDIGKKIDVTAVVTGNPDRGHILLDSRAHNIAGITMKSEVNDFDSMPDKFEINSVNGAVVSIADRNRGKNANR